MKFDFSTYLSPFSWRYGSSQMRHIFSEENKYLLWRKVWVALAQAEKKAGLLSQREFDDLKKWQNTIDIERILEIEKDTKHDVVAALREFAEKAKIGGGKIHLGATSQDIVDNAEMLRNKEALALIEKRLAAVLNVFSEKIKTYADLPCMGYTHLQPAEPTTLGYRFAFYAQDFLTDLSLLQFVLKTVKGKGIKGAVGTSASYEQLVKNSKISGIDLETFFTKALGIDAVLISTQVYPRKFDFLILTLLNSLASSSAKFAFDVRILQSPGFGEWQEPFGKKQVGSSAMPFKKNPFTSEKICSLARMVNMFPSIALENASSSLLERTLDDSANKRVIMPEAFLAVDDILITVERILTDLVIYKEKMQFNLEQYAPFSATEIIILEAVQNGGNRQEMHELLRTISMNAWEDVQKGKPNPMKKLLIQNKELKRYVSEEAITKALDVSEHIGNAPKRAKELTKLIQNSLSSHENW